MYNCSAIGKHETYFRGDIYYWKVLSSAIYVIKTVEFGYNQNLFNQIHLKQIDNKTEVKMTKRTSKHRMSVAVL